MISTNHSNARGPKTRDLNHVIFKLTPHLWRPICPPCALGGLSGLSREATHPRLITISRRLTHYCLGDGLSMLSKSLCM